MPRLLRPSHWLCLFALLPLAACDLLTDPGAPVTPSTDTTVVMAPLVPFTDTGLTWTRINVEAPPTDFGDLQINEVTAGGPGLVAVGVDTTGAYGDSDSYNDAAVWVSADGHTWTRIRNDDVFGGPEHQSLIGVTAGGPGLVAVGVAGDWRHPVAAVWLSDDGYTWTRLPHDEAVFGGPEDELMMRSVIVGGPGLVAIGSAPSASGARHVIWVSVDGYSWTRLSDEEAGVGAGLSRLHSVIAGGPGLMAAGWAGLPELSNDIFAPGDAAVWISVDGYIWTRVEDEAVFGGPEDQSIGTVVAGGPGFVAVGWDGPFGDAEGAVWVSDDGYTWTRIRDRSVFGTPNHRQQIGSVAAVGIGLVAVGSEQAWRDDNTAPDELTLILWLSDDGYTWRRVAHDETTFSGPRDQIFSLATWGPRLVAAGTSKGTSQDAVIWLGEPSPP